MHIASAAALLPLNRQSRIAASDYASKDMDADACGSALCYLQSFHATRLSNFSVCKPEVEALVAAICRVGKVVFLLRLRHGIPLAIATLVDVDIEELGRDQEDEIVASDADEDFVACHGVSNRVCFSLNVTQTYRYSKVESPLCDRSGFISDACKLTSAQPTLIPMMFPLCTHMLYSALATVRVRTEPALRDVIATKTAWK